MSPSTVTRSTGRRNKIGTSYHVLLGQPTVLPTQTINVPANQGIALTLLNGQPVALMSYSWFSTRLKNVINVLGVAPETFPMILRAQHPAVHGTLDNCCVIGYHGAGGSLTATGRNQYRPTCSGR